MIKLFFSSFMVLNLICLAIIPAQAKSYYYKFNEKASKMNFYVMSTLHQPVGDIKKFKGKINVTVNDNEEITKVDGLLEIQVASMVSFDNDPLSKDSDRDDKMKSQTLNGKKFPLIKFKVNEAKVTKNNLKQNNTLELLLIGPLTISGVSNNIEIPVKVHLSSPDRSKTALIEGSYGVNFKDFNLPDPSLPIIGKVKEIVTINFTLKTY